MGRHHLPRTVLGPAHDRACADLRAADLDNLHEFTTRLARLVPEAACEHIFDGLKVGTLMALTGLIVGEFVTAQAGLGYLVLFASSEAETGLVFAAVLFLCIIGLALYGAVALLQFVVMRLLGMPPLGTSV